MSTQDPRGDGLTLADFCSGQGSARYALSGTEGRALRDQLLARYPIGRDPLRDAMLEELRTFARSVTEAVLVKVTSIAITEALKAVPHVQAEGVRPGERVVLHYAEEDLNDVSVEAEADGFVGLRQGSDFVYMNPEQFARLRFLRLGNP